MLSYNHSFAQMCSLIWSGFLGEWVGLFFLGKNICNYVLWIWYRHLHVFSQENFAFLIKLNIHFVKNCRNPEIVLQDELSKRPCKNFLSTGVCNFMENCKFSHLTTDRKAELEKLVKEKQKARERKSADQQDKDPEKKLSEWLSKRSKTDDQDLSTRSDEAPLLPVYEIPPHVTQIQNPPPSILPPPADVLRGLSFVDWGWLDIKKGWRITIFFTDIWELSDIT